MVTNELVPRRVGAIRRALKSLGQARGCAGILHAPAGTMGRVMTWMGAVVVAVDDDYLPDPVIQIGDHMFPEPGGYLFKIVP